uniref:Lectin n=1 Tax=Latimeria menadoensis TaxID=106881 RepID=X2D383_LATME|nr:Lectin [Latimeria menadoensis]
MQLSIVLLPFLLGCGYALVCTDISGYLRQIDVSNGQVVGVNTNEDIFTRYQQTWVNIPGKLTHVTVGPAGIWGVNKDHEIFKLVGSSWQKVNGLLKQIDAGGDQFIAGANHYDDVFCLNKMQTISAKGEQTLSFTNIPGKLKYYSCGLRGCWGVNSNDDIFFRYDVLPEPCIGSKWQHVPGKLKMIEVGTDGSVYGVNSEGRLYQREGIADCNPIGTSWNYIENNFKISHVSYDNHLLWLILPDDSIKTCKV